MLEAFWVPILLPLLGALINGLLGARLRRRTIAWVSCLAAGCAFVVTLWTFFEFTALKPRSRVLTCTLFTWIESGDLVAECAFLLDPLSMVMLLIVTGVGFLIHLYSVEYMAGEAGFHRYFAYLNLFLFMMSLLVLADNYLLMFVGWEGVGLCSYLLIGHHLDRAGAGQAARKAFVVNRIGDLGFLLGIFLIFAEFGTLNYLQVFQQTSDRPMEPMAALGTLSALTLLLFVGATGKSAQIPLYVWLPDAMEGPTPVSALIHAATMVTAGVYMIARSAALYSRAPTTLFIIALVGISTALLAGLVATAQRDIKKVLAYSTISQLGYMFLALGVGAFGAGIFHLLTHAFFKALLFLGAGSVILALHHEQDLFRMGGLKKELQIPFYTMWAATLAIAGVPFLSGFFSKDKILWAAYNSSPAGALLWGAGITVACLTAFYMFRLMLLTFHGPPRGGEYRKEGAARLQPPSPAITIPLIALAFFSCTAGYIGLPDYLGRNRLEIFLDPAFQNLALPAPGLEMGHAPLLLELGLTAVAFLAALLGMAAAYQGYVARPEIPSRLAGRFSGAHGLLRDGFLVDEVYRRLLLGPIHRLARVVCWKTVEVGVIDRLVNGIAWMVQAWGQRARLLQSGQARSYASWIVAGATLILLYLYWGSRVN